jgi:hypothetical protein
MEAAIGALLTEATVEKAATKAGISYATLRCWMQEPSFKAAHRRARGELLERAVSRLLSLTTKAIDGLERNLSCGVVAVEVRAQLGLLTQAVKGAECLDLAGRVEELERIAQEAQRARSAYASFREN